MKYLFMLAILLWATCTFASDKKEPRDKDRSVIEGTFLQVSKLPAPEGNAYPDCYYTAIIGIDHIVSGQSIPRKVVLVLPGFFSRKYAPEAKFKIGDKVRATVVPFSSMPDSVRQTQQADEIEDVDLDFYFPERIAPVQEFEQAKPSVSFSSKTQKVTEPINLQPIDVKARAARRETMRQDLERIDKLLAEHGGNWDKWFESLKDFREQYKKQHDAKAERWIGDSFFSAGYVDNSKIYSPEFIKSIVAFKNYLAERNVDLILVRVPNKGEVVDDLFAPAPPDQVSNPHVLRMYKELLEADVEIITDTIPRAKELRLKYPLMYWYQNFSENHPAEGMSWVIAEEFAKRVSRYSRLGSLPKQVLHKDTFKKGPITESWQNLKWPAGNPKFSPTDYVGYATVVDDKKRPVELKKGFESPVLVLGSSFIAAPSLPNGGTIPHYFAYLTGIVPDLVYRRDADYMMPRTIAREGDELLRNRTVCLFPFVPWISQKALAPLPAFDPDSPKVLLASYSGPAMREAVEVFSVTPEGAFSYSPDGLLHIEKRNKEAEATISMRVKVPDSTFGFPAFIIAIRFTSNDVSSVTAKYSSCKDSIKRGPTLPNEEVFPFVTSQDRVITIEFVTDRFSMIPISIKEISFYGVNQPDKSTKLH